MMMVSSTGTCQSTDGYPSLEDIAAFLDGNLSPEERERMIGHLARCESCYEVFAGALHFQEETSVEDTVGRSVLPFPKKDRVPRRIPQWFPLAASFLLVAALGFMIWQYSRTLPELTVASLVEPLQEQPRVVEHRYQPEVERGDKEAEPIFSNAPPFLIGVHLVDLRLSASAGDVENTQLALNHLQRELAQVSFIRDSAKSSYDSPPRLESELQAWFDEDPFFAFGLWTEAGRLSALTRSPTFFERRVNRRFLSAIPRQISAENDERYTPILEDLQEIESLWDREEHGTKDYSALAGRFEHVIDQMERIQKQDQEDLSGGYPPGPSN